VITKVKSSNCSAEPMNAVPFDPFDPRVGSIFCTDAVTSA
jgi:hypothetical protein